MRQLQVTIRRVLGKDLYCLTDQSAPDLDVAAIEKRRCNAILARFCKFRRGVDAFAGVGVSARYWSSCTEELYLVECRLAALDLLRKNLPAITRPSCKVQLVPSKALTFLRTALERQLQFDFVDFDPFGTCYELLPLVKRLVPQGIICITTGEIFQVYRGINRRPGRPSAVEFRGHNVSQWVVKKLIPELVAACGEAKVVHFYAYPTSVRVIIALGGFRIPMELFKSRPQFLGWLSSREGNRASSTNCR
jgi:N2,N2-dimethylguanosine tRNA methyltransferase-like protein